MLKAALDISKINCKSYKTPMFVSFIILEKFLIIKIYNLFFLINLNRLNKLYTSRTISSLQIV